METITQAVLAEYDHLDHPLPLLSEAEWNITIAELKSYAESIEDKKPEDFNG
jgi:hypothetical protein